MELNEAFYVWMIGTIELFDVISTVFNKRVIFHNLFVMTSKCYHRVYSCLLNGLMNR